MKFLILSVCFLGALPLFAGKRIQMESTDLATKATEQDELLLDATRFRMNSGKTSAIFLTDGGRSRMLVLDKSRNEYMEIDQQTMDQMGQAMQGVAAQMEAAMKGMTPEQRAMMEQMMKGKMPAAAAAPAPTTTYTAKGRGSVNGIACTNYDGMRAGQKVSEICGPARRLETRRGGFPGIPEDAAVHGRPAAVAPKLALRLCGEFPPGR